MNQRSELIRLLSDKNLDLEHIPVSDVSSVLDKIISTKLYLDSDYYKLNLEIFEN